MARLRPDKEVREIKEGPRLVKKRDLFEIEQRVAVRIRDLRHDLVDCEPQIMHFGGHGKTDNIVLEDEVGNFVTVAPETLVCLFELFADKVVCARHKACFSQSQA